MVLTKSSAVKTFIQAVIEEKDNRKKDPSKKKDKTTKKVQFSWDSFNVSRHYSFLLRIRKPGDK